MNKQTKNATKCIKGIQYNAEKIERRKPFTLNVKNNKINNCYDECVNINFNKIINYYYFLLIIIFQFGSYIRVLNCDVLCNINSIIFKLNTLIMRLTLIIKYICCRIIIAFRFIFQ